MSNISQPSAMFPSSAFVWATTSNNAAGMMFLNIVRGTQFVAMRRPLHNSAPFATGRRFGCGFSCRRDETSAFLNPLNWRFSR